MSQPRVYTGKQPTVFMTGNVGAVVPGQEFDVPDENLAAFDARPDVSVPPPRRSVRKGNVALVEEVGQAGNEVTRAVGAEPAT